MQLVLRTAFILLPFLSVIPAFAQDSVRVELNLQLIEKFSLNFADNEILDIRSGKTNELLTSVVSDQNGRIQSSFSLPNDSAWFYLFPGSLIRMWDENLVFEGITSDTIINRCFELYPRKICHDTFLVPYIYFLPNSSEFADTTDFPIWVEGSGEISNLGFDLGYGLKIKSYCGYNESKKLAKKRLDMIVNDLVANGWPLSKLSWEVCGRKELFICKYCDGCHYDYLYGTGTTINRKTLGKQTETEKLRLESLRSCVTLEWNSGIVDEK